MDHKPSTQSLLLRALASAALLSLGWPPLPFAFLLFLAWVPFLQALDTILATREGLRVYRATWLFAFITFLVWNGLTTWWVSKATLGGGLFAVVVNSFLMTLPIMVYVAARRYLGNMASYMTLISAWITFEYLHMRWELTWPWLTLGNGFANQPAWVQWYDWTGALGGSLWILVVNIAIYRELRRLASYALGLSTRYDSSPRQRSTLALALAAARPALLIAVPLVVSLVIYTRRDPNIGTPVQVALLQTNYDPHTEKFALGPDRILGEMLAQSEQALRDSLHYLVWPETALTNNIDLATLDRHPSLQKIRAILEPYPDLRLIAGINGYRRYNDAASAPEGARAYDFPSGNRIWISAYNSALQLNNGGEAQVYNKGILVPGPEAYPYYEQLKWLNKVVPGLEDYMGNLSRSQYRESFWTHSPVPGSSTDVYPARDSLAVSPARDSLVPGSSTAVSSARDSLAVAPAICYESIFGEYVTGWTNGGAGLLFVVTNDGWWGNTAGRKQHLAYARLRAIENRRWVARCANTGISCFINQRGDVVADAGFDRAAVLEHTMYANTEVTPYMKHGDLVGRTAGWVVAGLVLLTLVSRLTGGLARRS